MNRLLAAALACAVTSTASFAQTAPATAAAAAGTAVAIVSPTQPAAPALLKLPVNTSLTIALNNTLSTKTFHTGDKFSLTVAQDVMTGRQVVIPKGTRAVGQVNWATGNGGFGKSGKIELVFRYVELDGKQIPIEGTYYQEGNGNTAGTVGAIMGAGVVGGLIVHGHSAEVPEGREFTVTTKDVVPFLLPGTGGSAEIDPAYAPQAVSMQVETKNERKARLKNKG